jgi:hypothetical protein
MLLYTKKMQVSFEDRKAPFVESGKTRPLTSQKGQISNGKFHLRCGATENLRVFGPGPEMERLARAKIVVSPVFLGKLIFRSF